MAEKMYIKQLYEDGVSKSEIQRRTKLNYRTVCKYADMEDWNDDKLPNMEPDHYPVLGEYIPLINEWLEGDVTAPRKQRHTAKRIYDRLRAEAGYTGGYSSVKRYVRKKRFVLRQGLAGCLPLAHPMAYAQVDFGEFLRCDTDGNEHKAYELVMSFPYSDKAYAQVFPSQNQECLLIGMRRIFEYIGGVPARIRFDNMSTAVAQVLEGTERKLTEGFTRFMLHYRFQADFAILHPAMRKAMLRTRSATSGATPSFRSLRSSALMSSTTTCLTGVKRTLNVRITSVVLRYRAFGKMKNRSC